MQHATLVRQAASPMFRNPRFVTSVKWAGLLRHRVHPFAASVPKVCMLFHISIFNLRFLLHADIFTPSFHLPSN